MEFTITQLNNTKTFVSVRNTSFHGSVDEKIAGIRDSTDVFLVLAGLKAYLEYGIGLNLIADRNPKEFRDH